jgi:hypothetical protein
VNYQRKPVECISQKRRLQRFVRYLQLDLPVGLDWQVQLKRGPWNAGAPLDSPNLRSPQLRGVSSGRFPAYAFLPKPVCLRRLLSVSNQVSNSTTCEALNQIICEQ